MADPEAFLTVAVACNCSTNFSGKLHDSLHDSLTVINGLVISKWSRAVFADMPRADWQPPTAHARFGIASCATIRISPATANHPTY